MAILNFPSNPSVDETYEENGVLYVWDGQKWTANTSANFLPLTGGTLTGDLTVPNLVSQGDVQTTSLNDGPLAGFRNQLINGDFRIWQRGLQVYSTPLTYTADRWKLANAGGSVQRSLINGDYALQCNAVTEIVQVVEISNYGTGSLPAPFLDGSTWTFSCVSTAQPTLVNFSWVDYAATASSLNAGINIVITDLGEVVPGANKYQYTFQVTNASSITATTNGFQVGLVLPSGTTITQMQLEPGPVATPFERRPIGAELQLCQRYYQIFFGGVTIAGATSGSVYTFATPYIVPIRPTIPIISYANTGYANASGITTATVGNYGVNTEYTATNNGWAGVLYTDIIADAEL